MAKAKTRLKIQNDDELNAANELIDFIKVDNSTCMYEELLRSVTVNLNDDCLDAKERIY